MKYRKYKSDMRGGNQVDSETLKQWRKETLEYLKKRKKNKFHYTTTGNSIVIGVRHDDGQIMIITCDNGYIEHNYEPKEKDKKFGKTWKFTLSPEDLT